MYFLGVRSGTVGLHPPKIFSRYFSWLPTPKEMRSLFVDFNRHGHVLYMAAKRSFLEGNRLVTPVEEILEFYYTWALVEEIFELMLETVTLCLVPSYRWLTSGSCHLCTSRYLLVDVGERAGLEARKAQSI